MNNLFEIIKNRATPGILIFDMNNKLHYLNKEADEILNGLEKSTKRPGKKNIIPEEIYSICNMVKTKVCKEKPPLPDKPESKVFYNKNGNPFSVRAFCVGFSRNNQKPTHIMVLIENIVEKRKIDYKKIKYNYKLTERELEVVELICNGLPNKEISKLLSISEYTVKDHIKNIMQKMNISSRSEIISLVI